jgi:hypothetical protein
MTINTFLKKLNTTPQAITFPETIAVIEQHYDFEPLLLRMEYNTMLLVKTQDLKKYLLCRNAG